MASLAEEKDSIKSFPSSSPSSDSSDPPFSVHDHALDHEDPRRDEAPDALPTSLRTVYSNNATSILTTDTNNPDYEVDWDDDSDLMNPTNWSIWYKGFTIFSVSWTTWCIVVYSTSYTTGLTQMQHDFGISSEPLVTLGVTTYCELVRVSGTSSVRN